VYDTSAPAYIGGQTGLNQPGLSQNPSGFSTTQTRPEHSAEKENVQPNTQGQNRTLFFFFIFNKKLAKNLKL